MSSMSDAESLLIKVYTPDSRLRNPGRLLHEAFDDLRASRDLAWRLMLRDINARYRQSLLGVAWAFLPMIFTTMTFVLLSDQQIISVGETYIPYPAYVMLGTALWQLFIEAVNSPIKMLSSSSRMMISITFPYEALLLSGIGQALFGFLIRLSLVAVIFGSFGVAVKWTIVLAPIGILGLLILGTTIGIILVPFGVLFRDIGQALAATIGFWMFLTPVIYAPPASGLLAAITRINPVTPVLVTAREWATGETLSYPVDFWIVLGISLIFLFVGWMIFRLAIPIISERFGS